jgi:TolB protein
VKGGLPESRLLITEPGGRGAKGYTSGPSDYAPACAPDGSAVVWVSVTDDGRDVMMSRTPALNGEVRRLGPGRDPAFSPDSEWIVYTTPVGRRWDLHRIRADGSGRRSLGGSIFDDVQPSFSPDGRLVIYVSDDGLEQRIHVRRFDGTGDRVLFTDGGGSDPIW